LQKGLSEGSGTRSSLVWQVKRLLLIAKEHGELPNALLMENVKALVSKKFMPDFQLWLSFLDSLGYKSFWQVLNGKDYGVPQNRERVFAVSFLDRKAFSFPEKIPLEKRLKDVLEHNVDDKYYLSDEITQKLITQIESKEISNAVRGGRASTDRHSWDLVKG
jgi:DNA (cytosine-5)-methyltransferase 1